MVEVSRALMKVRAAGVTGAALMSSAAIFRAAVPDRNELQKLPLAAMASLPTLLLLQGRTADQQRDAVISGFPQVPPWFRRAFPYSKWGAEVNAKITPAFL